MHGAGHLTKNKYHQRSSNVEHRIVICLSLVRANKKLSTIRKLSEWNYIINDVTNLRDNELKIWQFQTLGVTDELHAISV